MYLNNFVNIAAKYIFNYEEPLKYLIKRGFTREDIEKYQIGFTKYASIKKDASEDYTSLYERTYGFKRLQNKIIFPLKNTIGLVNGLTTRSIQGKKYSNFFLSESKNIGAFFGLYEAIPHIYRTKIVFVHEGGFNAMAFAKVLPNSVASLTAYLNEQQFELLAFFANKIILIYDQDTSGLIGVKKTIEYYGSRYIESVCIGPDDPNAYLIIQGPEKFDKYIRSKIPLFLQK